MNLVFTTYRTELRFSLTEGYSRTEEDKIRVVIKREQSDGETAEQDFVLTTSQTRDLIAGLNILLP